ncbi:MAG: MBL fold metallo-hydrolase [Anaerolineae bacterium]
MMIIQLSIGLLGSNCYLIYDRDGGAGAVVDPGFREGQRLEAEIAKHNLTIRYILNTHGHFDHVAGNGRLDFPHAELGIHPADRDLLMQGGGQIEVDSPPPELDLLDNAEISFGDLRLLVIHTPGHTPGSVSFYLPDHNAVLTGDTLFRGSVGRTDLPGGDLEQLRRSLRRLLSLPDETRVFPGHGPDTTIGRERGQNPWLRQLV